MHCITRIECYFIKRKSRESELELVDHSTKRFYEQSTGKDSALHDIRDDMWCPESMCKVLIPVQGTDFSFLPPHSSLAAIARK